MKRAALLAAILAALCSPAFAQGTFTFKDAAGATQTAKSFNCTANICNMAVPADSTGAAFGVTANPFFMNTQGWAGGTLGAMANYGTSPGAVLVPGVNAFITNVPTVAQATAANLNATVVGTVTANLGTIAGVATATNQTNASQKSQIVDGSGNVITSTTNALNVDVINATPGIANNADGIAAVGASSTSPVPVNNYSYVFNGSTFDRMRSGTQTGSVLTNTAANVTPTDCSGTITTGGTAQSALAAQTALHGLIIGNIDTSAGSGEPLWISFTTTAAASTVASYPLAAPTATTFAGLSSFTAPPGFGLNHALSIVGATTGHKYSCTWW